MVVSFRDRLSVCDRLIFMTVLWCVMKMSVDHLDQDGL